MRSTSLSRRVLGIVAAGTVGLSAAVLGAPGVALAEDEVVLTTPAETSPAADDGTEVLAAAPATPYLNYADGIDGGLDLDFVDQSVAPDAATSFEASVDNGSTWHALTDVEVINGRTYGTLGGLTNGSTYTVVVRAVNSSGHSGTSNSATGTAYRPIGAPTGLLVTRTTTGVTVSWGAPATAGTYPQDLFVAGYSAGQSGNDGCEVAATARSCSFPLPTGEDYLVTVFAVDTQGFLGDPVRAQSGAVGAPATPTAVPTKDDGDLVGPAGPISKVTAGQQVVLQGAGYLPGSSVRLALFSTPVDLGTVVVASDGTFSATVTIPAGLANGTHTLVATGVAPDGTTRNLVITVTVSGGTAVAALANTGFDATPVALGGGLAMLAGAGLLVGSRRRSSN